MHSRLYVPLAALALLPLVAGCVQATRHSNTMIFGTNTTVGFKVGSSASQVPEILLAYDRQELVIMPLLANVQDRGNDLLQPCDPTRPAEIVGDRSEDGEFLIHPCSFVGYREGSLDSYSVLASFGASFDAHASSAPEASGGLAQYFATGIAAQMLAFNGGAAVVNTTARTSAAQTLAASAVFASEQERAASVRQISGYAAFETRFLSHLETLNDQQAVQFVARFEEAAGLTLFTGTGGQCSSKPSCIEAVGSGAYLYSYGERDLDAALTAAFAGTSS
ncbi:MAG: hypothetical protein ACTS1X_10210 [Parasphingopyxis sp.]|uniref:hypothetical protein n=1 Tax=Parasphingopyxis sp. TaxID=1920299 RepID=UPI003F9ECCDA